MVVCQHKLLKPNAPGKGRTPPTDIMLQAMSFNPSSSLHSVSLRYSCITVQQVREFVLVSFLNPNKSTRLIQLCPVKVKAVFTYCRLVKARNKQRLHQLNFISFPLHFSTLRSVSRMFTPSLSHSHGST
jgi:hypothetical protein